MRCVLTCCLVVLVLVLVPVGLGRSSSSCWRTSRVLGQLPPRRIWRAVARSLASSWGKCGTLGKRVRVRGVRGLFTFVGRGRGDGV